MGKAYRQSLVGTVQEVLFEERDGQYFTGHAPNYVKIYAEGENLHNQIKKVMVLGLYKEGILGKVLESC